MVVLCLISIFYLFALQGADMHSSFHLKYHKKSNQSRILTIMFLSLLLLSCLPIKSSRSDLLSQYEDFAKKGYRYTQLGDSSTDSLEQIAFQYQLQLGRRAQNVMVFEIEHPNGSKKTFITAGGSKRPPPEHKLWGGSHHKKSNWHSEDELLDLLWRQELIRVKGGEIEKNAAEFKKIKIFSERPSCTECSGSSWHKFMKEHITTDEQFKFRGKIWESSEDVTSDVAERGVVSDISKGLDNHINDYLDLGYKNYNDLDVPAGVQKAYNKAIADLKKLQELKVKNKKKKVAHKKNVTELSKRAEKEAMDEVSKISLVYAKFRLDREARRGVEKGHRFAGKDLEKSGFQYFADEPETWLDLNLVPCREFP